MPHTSSYSGSAKSAHDAKNRPSQSASGSQMDTLQVPGMQRNVPADAVIAALELLVESEQNQGDSSNSDSRMPKANSVARILSNMTQGGTYKPSIKRESSVTEMFKKPVQSYTNIYGAKHDEEPKPSLNIGISASAVSDFDPNRARMGKLNSFPRRIEEDTPGFNEYSEPSSPKNSPQADRKPLAKDLQHNYTINVLNQSNNFA